MPKPYFFLTKQDARLHHEGCGVDAKTPKTKRKCDKCDNRAGQEMTIGIGDSKYLFTLLYFDVDTMRSCKVV